MDTTRKISVVTVTYNAEKVIEETLESIISQNYPNIEIIVVDGESKDSTLEIISNYKDRISTFISEKDDGIYDAMNKGIDVASGEYIIFMNAGDKFYNSMVLSSINASLQGSSDSIVIYGSTLIHYPFGDYIVEPDSPSELYRCMPFCHQSVLVRTDVIREFKFMVSLKIAGDHNQLLRIYQMFPDKFLQYSGVISEYEAISGISAKNTMKGYSEGKSFATSPDSIFRKIRIWMRASLPNNILTPLFRIFFFFNSRYHRVK